MRDFEHTFNVLSRVIEEGLSFNLAINSEIKKEKRADPSLKNVISASSGSVLRHYYLFKEIITRQYGEIKESKFILLAMGLANRLFSKRFEEETLLRFIEKESELDDVKSFIETFTNEKSLIPEDITLGSKKYLSLRYNLPLWVVDMWEKNAGDLFKKRLFPSIYKSQNLFARVNTRELTREQFLEKYSGFEPLFDDYFVKYCEKGNIRKHESIINGDAFNYSPCYSLLLADLDVDPYRGIAFYSACNNQLLYELAMRLGTGFKADYLCRNQQHFFEANKAVKQLGLTDISLYECSEDAILTCISKPVHTFFVCPNNSSFLNLKDKPDYFLRIKQEDLDSFIHDEYSALINASAHVEDGGYLIYFIPTFCKNESKGVIRKFLKVAPSFKLEKEIQLFPFDKYQTLFYFAVLKKEVSND